MDRCSIVVDFLLWFGAPLVFCIVLAVALGTTRRRGDDWRNGRDNHHDTDRSEPATTLRRESPADGVLQPADWLYIVAYAVVGVWLGIALDGLVWLLTNDYWVVAVLLVLMFGGIVLFDALLDWGVDRLFPGGVRKVLKSARQRRSPWLRRWSLPAGVVLGVILARLGLDSLLVGALS